MGVSGKSNEVLFRSGNEERIVSIFDVKKKSYAHLVPSGSAYIESWYVSLNENARVGGNA